MYVHEDYRPGYNPEFVKAAMAKRRERQAAAKAEQRKIAATERAEAQRQDAAERARIKRERQAAMEALREHQIAIDTIRDQMDIMPDDVFRHTYRDVERRACKLFRVSKSEIASSRRSREVVFARQFVMYWAGRLTTLSYPQIGRLMGGKDHTTVLHGARIYPVKRTRMGRHLPSKSSFYARQHSDRET